MLAKSNYKHKSNITKLVGVEGEDGPIFIEHLKNLYTNRKSLVQVTVYPAGGGSVQDIINRTAKKFAMADYSQGFCIIDDDRDEWKRWQGKIKNDATEKGIQEIIALQPICLECFLLGLLNEKTCNSSKDCKSAFKRIFKTERKVDFDNQFIARRFPKQLIEQQRKKNQLLDYIIKTLFERGI